MKKVLIFFGLFFAAIGLLGGIGATLYCKSYPCAAGLLALAWLAAPKAKALFTDLMA